MFLVSDGDSSAYQIFVYFVCSFGLLYRSSCEFSCYVSWSVCCH